VSFLKAGASALGKLVVVAALAAAFLVGLLGVVYLSLRGEEIKVPEIVGKGKAEAEKELSALGLKMKKRADRYSQEQPNTILEQSPKAGTTAKTGQQILVVVSQINPESSEEAPATVDKGDDETPTDANGDKPQKTNKNANVKKPTQTTRDVSANKANKNSNVNTGPGTANTSKSNTTPVDDKTKTAPPTPGNRSTTPAGTPKPSPTKTPTNGDLRSRKVPN
jgi:hypothetical protein